MKYRLSKKKKKNPKRKQKEILRLRSILLEVLTKFFGIYSHIVKVSSSGAFEKLLWQENGALMNRIVHAL